jgi:hypothetical protein
MSKLTTVLFVAFLIFTTISSISCGKEVQESLTPPAAPGADSGIKIPCSDGSGVQYIYFFKDADKCSLSAAKSKCSALGGKLVDLNDDSLSKLHAIVRSKSWVGSLEGVDFNEPVLYYPPIQGRDGEFSTPIGATALASDQEEANAFVCQLLMPCNSGQVTPAGCLALDLE